jgi:small-conductance mechanosensitive channel
MLRREHYVLTMNEYMRMISQAIKEQNIELAIDKLSNSEVSRLKTLIPREEKQ